MSIRCHELFPALVALVSLAACATRAATGVTRDGAYQGATQYRISQDACPHAGKDDCAPMAKTCPAGYTIVGYTDQVILFAPPAQQARYEWFTCQTSRGRSGNP